MKIKTIIAFLAIVFFNLSTIGVTNAAKVDKLKFAFCDYIGETKKGKAHYMGSLTCEDGTNYVGEFRRNIINGDGILVILPPVIVNDWLKENPFPQISDKEKIIKLIEEVVERMIDFKDVDNILTEEGQEKMREMQKNMKLALFRSPGISSWYANYLKEVVEVRGLMTEEEFLEKSQIFAGKWKNGKFIEYFDPKKKFRRVVKLNKLKDIGGEREGNQDGDGNQAIINAANAGNIGDQGNIGNLLDLDGGGVIPGDGEKGEVKDKGVKTGVDGTKQTGKIDFGNGITYEGETKTVDGKTLAHGIGTFTNAKNGDTYTGEVRNGAPGGKGKVAFGDDGGVIEGTWDKDGGKGTYTNEKTGDNYEGEFAFEDGEDGPEINPVGDGQGSHTDPDTGIKRDGTFKDGELVDGTISDGDGRSYTGSLLEGRFIDGKVSYKGDIVTFKDGMPVEVNGEPSLEGFVIDMGPFTFAGAAASNMAPSTNALIEDATLEMKGKGNKFFEAKIDIDVPAENIDPADLIGAAAFTNKAASGSNTGSNATGGFSMTEAGKQAEKDGGSGSGEKGSDGGGEGAGDGGGSM